MSMSINTVLSQAYGLIEADKLVEATELLKPVLAEYPNNADAWWLYAHAVTDVDDARAALQTILQIDPQYPEAGGLLEMLEEATRGQFITNPLTDMQLQPIRAIPELPEAMPEVEPMSPAERELAYAGTERPAQRGFPWGRIALLALLFIAAIAAALLLSQSALAPGGEPTQVAGIGDADLTQTADAANGGLTGVPAQAATDAALAATATAIIEQVNAATVDPDAAATGTAVVAAASVTADSGFTATAGSATIAAGTPTADAAQTEEPTNEPLEGTLEPLNEDFNATGTSIVQGATQTAASEQGVIPTEDAVIAQAGQTATALVQGATQTAETEQEATPTADAALDAVRQTATAIIAGATGTADARAAEVTPSPTPIVGDAQAVALEPVQAAFTASFGEQAVVSVETTAEGDTLVIRLCSQAPGILLRATLDEAVETLQGQASLLRFGIDGVGYRLVDCANDGEYRLLTSSLDDALAYADGSLDLDAYQARLRAR